MLCLVFGIASCTKEPQLPEIPAFNQLGFEDALEAVKTQMHSAYERWETEPDNHERNGHMGMLLSAYGKNATSEIFFRRAHQLNPSEFRWIYFLAIANQQLGRYDEAIALFQKAQTVEPDSNEVRLQLARVLLQHNEFEASRDLYKSITSELPENVEGWFGLGKAYDGLGETNSALAALEEARRLGPRYGEVRYALASVLRDLGRDQDAAREFAAYEKRVRAKINTSDQYTRSVIRLNASDGPFLAKADYQIARGQFKEAADFFRRALEINPANQDAWGGLVFSLSKLADKDATTASYADALAAGIHYKRLHFTYGQALERWGQFDEARRVLGEAIKLDPKYTEALTALGVLELKHGSARAAVQHFGNAVAVTPNDRELRLDYAQALVIAEQYEQAVVQLEPLTTDPNAQRIIAFKELGLSYDALGRKDEAIAALESGRELADKSFNTTMVENFDELLSSARKR